MIYSSVFFTKTVAFLFHINKIYRFSVLNLNFNIVKFRSKLQVKMSADKKNLTIQEKQELVKKKYQIEHQKQEKQLNQSYEQIGFFQNLSNELSDKVSNVTKNMFGDYSYLRQNRYTVKDKMKILKYLKEKFLLIQYQLQEQNQKSYYNYDPNFFKKKTHSLLQMKNLILTGRSQIEMVDENLKRIRNSRNYLKATFLNESAYEFDRQRYCSIFWGLMVGALINSTIYRNGKDVRKAALFVTVGHLFGQISYHVNLDRYFDSVYAVFEEQAKTFMRKQQKVEQQHSQKTWIKNSIQ